MESEPETMVAVRHGGATTDQIKVTAGPRPVAREDEVLVRVEASAVNPFDLGIALGRTTPGLLGHIPGRDVAGIVEAGPAELIGRPVWATGGEFGLRRDGFHAEYAVLPATGCGMRPSRLSTEESASVGVAFTTAWYGLIETGAMQLGDRVLISGAAGAVGSAALQLARWSGIELIIALVRNDSEAEVARKYGATMTVQEASLLAKLDADHRPTLCLDTVGSPVVNDVVGALDDGGRIVNISTPGDGMATIDLRTFYRHRLVLRGLGTGAYDATRGAQVLEQLRPGFESGRLQPPQISEVFPLARAAEAYGLLNSAHPPGKVVLQMSTSN
jgi:NADPH2:quinone reductase